MALVGGYSGVRAFKRGRRSQRVIIVIALVLIYSSLVTATFLNRAPDSTPPSPDYEESF